MRGGWELKLSEVEGVGVSYSGIEGQYYRCTGSNSVIDTFPEMFYATLIKNYKISDKYINRHENYLCISYFSFLHKECCKQISMKLRNI